MGWRRGRSDRYHDVEASMTDFELQSGDLLVRASFPEPVFDLFQDFPDLGQRLHRSLATYGAGLGDMKFEGTWGSLGDAHLSVSFLRLSAVLRVRLDQIELHCFDARNLQEDDLAAVFVRTSQVLVEHDPAPAVASYSLAVGLHGLLAGVTAATFIERFVSAKDLQLGPPSGVGTVLYFGPSKGRSSASVTMDLSALVAGGLFLRANATWDASTLDVHALQSAGREFIDQVTSQLGLAVR